MSTQSREAEGLKRRGSIVHGSEGEQMESRVRVVLKTHGESVTLRVFSLWNPALAAKGNLGKFLKYNKHLMRIVILVS